MAIRYHKAQSQRQAVMQLVAKNPVPAEAVEEVHPVPSEIIEELNSVPAEIPADIEAQIDEPNCNRSEQLMQNSAGT